MVEDELNEEEGQDGDGDGDGPHDLNDESPQHQDHKVSLPAINQTAEHLKGKTSPDEEGLVNIGEIKAIAATFASEKQLLVRKENESEVNKEAKNTVA